MFKKITISFILAVFLLISVSIPIVKAEEGGGVWYNQSFQEWFSKVYDDTNPNEIFGERYTAAQVQWILYSLAALPVVSASGASQDIITCVMNNQLDECADAIEGIIGFKGIQDYVAKQDAVSPLGKIFSSDRSLSGINYIKSKASNLGLIPEAQAQEGFGFGALGSVQNIWRAFRNITYALFILLIVAVAFMIMFRVKISPQAVISIQSALPRIVIALILITFSYAIAGFLIDLLYVVFGLIALIFSNSAIVPFLTKWDTTFDVLVYGPIPGLGFGIWGWIIIYSFIFFIGMLIAFFGSTVGMISSLNLATGGLGIIFGIIGLIAWVILSIVFFISAVKIVWMMFKTFANILILVIFAPLQIALGILVPTAGFSAWVRNMLANLAVYPVVGILILLAFTFLQGAYSPLIEALASLFGAEATTLLSSEIWSPPLTIGIKDVEIFNPAPLLWLGVSFAIFTIIPKTADMIKSLIEGKPFTYGTAVGEALGPVRGGVAVGVSGAGTAIAQKGVSPGGLPDWKSKGIQAATDTLSRMLGGR